MKLKMALAVAALSVIAASAQAQLSIELDAPNANLPSTGGTVDFNGFVSNGLFPVVAGPTITLDGDSASGPVGLTFDLPNTDLIIGVFPTDVANGTRFRGDYLFSVDVPASFAGQTINGFYTVFGSDANGGSYTARTPFSITVAGTAVPEPGSVALLLGSMVGGTVLLRRRRK